MSSENVEVVRRWTDAYNRRDFDEIIQIIEPDFDFKSRFVAIESGFQGHERFPYEYFRTLDEAYDRFHITASEFLDAGAAVLMVATAEWRGKASGAEGQLPIFVACWLRAGKILRVETFTERAEGLLAVGLT